MGVVFGAKMDGGCVSVGQNLFVEIPRRGRLHRKEMGEVGIRRFGRGAGLDGTRAQELFSLAEWADCRGFGRGRFDGFQRLGGCQRRGGGFLLFVFVDELEGWYGESVTVEFEEVDRGKVGCVDTALCDLCADPCFVFALCEPRLQKGEGDGLLGAGLRCTDAHKTKQAGAESFFSELEGLGRCEAKLALHPGLFDMLDELFFGVSDVNEQDNVLDSELLLGVGFGRKC